MFAAVSEPQQISTISGITTISSIDKPRVHLHHLDDIPDDVPEELVTANKTALKTLVDISTPPVSKHSSIAPGSQLIRIQTHSFPHKSDPIVIEDEDSRSPPPPPPPPRVAHQAFESRDPRSQHVDLFKESVNGRDNNHDVIEIQDSGKIML